MNPTIVAVLALFPIVAELHVPVKVCDVLDIGVNQARADIAVVHVDNDEGAHENALELSKVGANKIHGGEELGLVFLEVLLRHPPPPLEH